MVAALLLAAGGSAAAQSARTAATTLPSPVTEQQVLRHLRRTIAWYRMLSTMQQSTSLADNALARSRLQASSLTAVQFAFEFANAAAKLVDAQPKAAQDTAARSDSTNDAARLDRVAARIATRLATLQGRVAALDSQIARAPARARPALTAQRSEAAAAVTLTLEVQGTIQQLQRFAATSAAHNNGGSTLAAKVENLQRTIPESRTGSATTQVATGTTSPHDSGSASASSAASAAGAFRPQSAGLVALTSQWLALRSTERQLAAALQRTDALSGELDTLRSAVSKEVRGLVRTSLSDSAATDPQQILASQRQLESAAARFKQLSTMTVPLGEQDITMDDVRGALSEWSDVFSARSDAVMRSLLLHAIVLAASIVLVLVVSEIWRRATFRYLHDARRRRQFLVLRRVVVTIALLLIIILGFVSEIGSLATYVGFLTAGLAVALQNVILAIVAYFFLIGRYGVRVGDRITLAGVTGRVIDIGLIRIYLTELAGPELQPTGRIVVLSNAVLFQPAALFKQIPGADYVWHTVTLTLAPTVDVAATQQQLKAVADKVYATYRPAIDEQHAAVQRLVDFDTARPEPQVDVRYTEQALEFVVRYPVLPEQAAANDQVMIKALREVTGDEHVAVATPA